MKPDTNININPRVNKGIDSSLHITLWAVSGFGSEEIFRLH
jgi:hypothetical protein